MTTTDTLSGEAVELASMAGLALTDRQRDSLAAMLAVREDGKWATSNVALTLGRDAEDVLTARALAGLLLLDERILWSAHRPITYRYAFAHFTHLLHRLAGQIPADLKTCKGNGRERVYSTGTAAEVRFTGHRANNRGLTFDTLIVQESDHWTYEQQDQLMPVMASVPNPQLIRAINTATVTFNRVVLDVQGRFDGPDKLTSYHDAPNTVALDPKRVTVVTDPVTGNVVRYLYSD